MDVRSLSGGLDANSFLQASQQSDTTQLNRLRSQVASLNQMGASGNQEFKVARDPATQRFVVQLVDRDTKTIIDQFPSEGILERAAQLGLS